MGAYYIDPTTFDKITIIWSCTANFVTDVNSDPISIILIKRVVGENSHQVNSLLTFLKLGFPFMSMFIHILYIDTSIGFCKVPWVYQRLISIKEKGVLGLTS
jgi:hypothetical protein